MSPQNNTGRADAGMGAAEMALRGFDDYEVTLGDEMRGQRASLGVSLADVERDLRIKASTILAIENADIGSFPNQSVIAGYVRSYARYLDMDPEQSYRRFCDESGFRSPAARVAVAAPGANRVAINNRVGAGLTESRFAPTAAPQQLGSGVSFGAAASVLALTLLVAGLSFGGYYLLQDIQKVGVASIAEAPEIVVEASPEPLETMRTASVPRPDAGAYEDGGVLAFATPEELPPSLPSRDGPIAELDPSSAGLFAPVGKLDPMDPRGGGTALADAASSEPADQGNWKEGVVLASLNADAMMSGAPTDAERLTMSASATAEELAPIPDATFIYATGEAWVRVKDANGTVVFEGILNAGERFKLPEGMTAPELRAGNAGDVYILLGRESYGPLGQRGRVVKDVPLEADAVRKRVPAAEGLAIEGEEIEPLRRASL